MIGSAWRPHASTGRNAVRLSWLSRPQIVGGRSSSLPARHGAPRCRRPVWSRSSTGPWCLAIVMAEERAWLLETNLSPRARSRQELRPVPDSICGHVCIEDAHDRRADSDRLCIDGCHPS